MPPRMEPRATRSVSEASSWRGRPLREYSPLFGRLPAAFQPVIDVDSDGDAISVLQRGGKSYTYHTAHGGEGSGSYAPPTLRELSDFDDLDDEGHASILASTVALVKSILGIGLVSMPYICSEVGVVPYVTFLAVFTLPSHFANICLACCVDLVLGPWNGVGPRIVERADYLTLGVIAFGSWAQWAILVIFLIVIWGGTVSLFIALWDILQGYVSDVPLLDSSAFFVPLLGALVFPLCCLDSLHALRHTSYLGILGIACLAASLGYWAVKSHNSIDQMEAFALKPSGIALLPVFVFSYMGQFNFIRVYSELQRRTPARVGIVSFWSLFMSFVFYSLVGVGGYLAFLKDTSQDIFSNYEHLGGVPTHGARVLFAFSLIFTTPVYLFEARNMVEDILSVLLDSKQDREIVNQQLEDEDYDLKSPGSRNMTRRVLVVVALLTTMCVMAVVYPHVVQVLGILGATTSTAMMMILPPAFLLRISRFTKQPLSPRMRWACRIFCALGFACIPFFLALVIWQLVDPQDSSGSGSEGAEAPIDNATSVLSERWF